MNPPPNSTVSDETSPPDSLAADPLAVLLAEEQAGERWIRLDPENLLRAKDFRRLRQTEHYQTETMVDGQRHHVQWPLPGLTINGDLELPTPLWTVDELLAQIGAEIVEPPRSLAQVEWVVGKLIH